MNPPRNPAPELHQPRHCGGRVAGVVPGVMVQERHGAETPSAPSPRPGVTERLAVASARRPRRTLVIWGIVVVVALVCVGTSLKGLTTSAHVVGATESTEAQALYNQVIGAQAGRTPTDVIVVSSAHSNVAAPDFQAFVSGLVAQVRLDPGVSNVATDLRPGSPFVSSDHHAALVELRVASDSAIKPVVRAVQEASGRDGIAAAVTGDHTVGNDFTTQSASDLKHGELDFGLPIALIVLVLVFGAVIAGLMPVLMALLSIVVGLGIAALVAREFSLWSSSST
jgi:putative drug exporter of the RND superfamily